MATTQAPAMTKPVKGGSFLVEERKPEEVFTPKTSPKNNGKLPRQRSSLPTKK